MASNPIKRARSGHEEQPNAEHPPHATARAAIVRVAIVGLFVIAVLFTLDFAHAILIPIVAAMLLGTVLSPVVERMLKYHIPAPLGAGLLVIALVLITIAVAAAIAQPLSEWLEYLPATMGNVSKSFLQWWTGMSGRMG